MDYTYLLIAQVAVDLFLVASLIYLILSMGRKDRLEEEKRIKGILDLLDRRIDDANTAATRLSSDTESGIDSLKGLSKGIETKKIELQHYLERIDGVLKAIDEVTPSDPPHIPPLLRGGEGGAQPDALYKEASKLAEQGYGVDEIVKRLGLPKGEVQLIMGLKKQ